MNKFIAAFFLILNIFFPATLFAEPSKDVKVIHVFVALCDNKHQNIAKVASSIGNGDDPDNNLYWGAYYGIRSYFKKSQNWELLQTFDKPEPVKGSISLWSKLRKNGRPVLQRCVFRHRIRKNVYMVADAYRGKLIKQAMSDFFRAAAGASAEDFSFNSDNEKITVTIHGSSQMVCYIGHDGLMDFSIRKYPKQSDNKSIDVIMLSCYSKRFFEEGIKAAGANPLIWTTSFMAPEAYTLESALEGWIRGESPQQIRNRAAVAYHKYQKCGFNAAKRLLVTGF